MNIPRALIWPTATFNTCTPDGMAAAEAWARGLVGDDEPERPALIRSGIGYAVWDGWRYRPARPLPPPKPRLTPYTTYAGIPLGDPTTTEDN